MAQWNSIEDETGMTYVTSTPHFCFEDGKAAFRTDDVDVSAAVIDGRLLKVVVADNDAVEAVGFVAMREKVAESLSADLEYLDLLADITSTTDYLGGSAALGDMTATDFTYSGATTFASHVFTRTASAANTSLVFDTNAVAGTLYKVVITGTVSAGGYTPVIGATIGTEITTSTTTTEYIRATDTTAFTMDFEDDGAGTITAMYVYAIDETAYTVSTSNTQTIVGTDLLVTWVDGDDFVVITLDDLLGTTNAALMTLGNYYKLTIGDVGMGTGDTIGMILCNSGDETCGDARTVTDTDADHDFYFHYEEDMYITFSGGDASDVLEIGLNGWELKEVHRLGTDALVIMNGDGEKYQWDSKGTDFDENSDDYTFDIYEMRGGVAGETQLATAPQCFGDQDLLSRATSRDSTMEYPDHKDMEDFD